MESITNRLTIYIYNFVDVTVNANKVIILAKEMDTSHFVNFPFLLLKIITVMVLDNNLSLYDDN